VLRLRSGCGARRRRADRHQRRVLARDAGASAGAEIGVRRRRQSWRAVVIIPFLAVIAVVYAFPIYWLIATSLKSRSQLFQATLSLFPDAPTLQPYADVLIDRGMW